MRQVSTASVRRTIIAVGNLRCEDPSDKLRLRFPTKDLKEAMFVRTGSEVVVVSLTPVSGAITAEALAAFSKRLSNDHAGRPPSWLG